MLNEPNTKIVVKVKDIDMPYYMAKFLEFLIGDPQYCGYQIVYQAKCALTIENETNSSDKREMTMILT